MAELAIVEKPMREVGVLLVEPHEACRRELERMISVDTRALSVVGTAATSFDALGTAAAIGPDVVLLGVHELDDFDAIGDLTTVDPEIRVLVLSLRDDGEAVFEAIRRGAVGFMPKWSEPEDIVDALWEVAKGGVSIHPSVVAQGFRWAANVSSDAPAKEQLSRLTDRERQIMEMLSQGATAPSIAEQLVLSRRTVETHLMNSYRKLGVHNQIEAVYEFTRLKWQAS